MLETEQDAMSAASNVYRLIMENDQVRVLKAVFKPGDTAKMHHHPDHVVYAFKGGKARLTSQGKTDVIDLKTDQAIFLEAQTHEAVNIGNTNLELLVIELKR